jgi:hypothetical protein
VTRNLHLDPDHENEPTTPHRPLLSPRAERWAALTFLGAVTAIVGLLVAVGLLVNKTIELAPVVRTASTGCATVCAAPCPPCPEPCEVKP